LFVRTDPPTHHWWAGVCVTTAAANLDTAAKLTELRYLRQLAVLSYESDRKTLEHHWETADKLLEKITSYLQPWEKPDERSYLHKAKDRMMDQYVAEFGEPGSPEHEAAIDKILEHWNSTKCPP
jgi:hypothetical protein